ncbi:MAG: DUF3499 domain-containing protein [Actinomycetota bacterium]|nr:DUF3499 domain-containing protein [Actinomycetota bacterium]
MADLEAEVCVRVCSHSGCNGPAEVSLGFHYARRLVWLEELQPGFEPDRYDLCEVHLKRFSPPRGWETEDRRTAVSRSA